MAFRSYRAASFNFGSYRGTGAGARVLQRRCACGSKSESDGQCAECAEKEGVLQRKSSSGRTGEAPPIVYDVLRAPGQPLDTESRDFMEARFGYDFSGVRVHSDEQAHRSADETDAEAYTVGQDIVFASGRYSPHSEGGRELLAHELTHVVQQGFTGPGATGAITMGKHDEHETSADTTAQAVVSGAGPTLTRARATGVASVGLQRQEAEGEEAGNQGKAGGTTSKAPCLEELVGEDVPSLLQAGVLTVIEFGGASCKPCQRLKAQLAEICAGFEKNPPPVTVRFYSIDVEDPGNEDRYNDWTPGGSVPHLYFYVGSSQQSHYDSAPEPDALDYIMAQHIEYANTSGAKRGAKKGMKWGVGAGAVAGIAGAIAIGTQSNLEGNAMMGAILGTIVGGAAVGLGLGAAIGAIAGHATDDRNKGPKDQKRKKLQKKSRHDDAKDREEREADLWAAHVSRNGKGNGRPLETATRGFMEDRFNHDFSHVRVHRDASLESIAPGMDAYAATTGSDIYFAPDVYAPGTRLGREVLGHELAHVIQNESTAPVAGVSTLESEADRAAASVANGRKANVAHGSNQPVLGLSGRAKKTLKSMAAATGIFGAIGVGIGAAAASKMTGKPYGEGMAWGGLIGGLVGLASGFLYGFFSRRSEFAEAPEAEVAIRNRFGSYISGKPAGLNNALIKPVDQADLCIFHRCRMGPDANCTGLQGWTDTGPPPPNKIEAADEPKCANGQTLAHATPERPVIYYSKQNRDAATIIHEGLHAYADPAFPGQMPNDVNEGVTEYFTRQITSDLNLPDPEKDTYNTELAEVKRMVPIMGEDTLRAAYFKGDIKSLNDKVNQQLGACALTEWAAAVQTLNFDREKPKRIIEDKTKPNYCVGNESSSAAPVAAPPAEEKPA